MASATKYSHQEIQKIFSKPFPELIYEAQSLHRKYHDPNSIQFCTLSSIKTGACPEDCNYCSQSARYDTGLNAEPLISEEAILKEAAAAKNNGSTRFCMGAAWRSAPKGADFDRVLSAISKVKAMGLEPCATLGMLTPEQALALKEAGLHSYNHNIDSSPEYYPQIISTRSFEDRIETIMNVRAAGIEVCCGGILGLGESAEDRISFLAVLANMDPQPSSVPINVLVPIEGTPQYQKLEAQKQDKPNVDPFDLLRCVATARILMPQARIRLSAGRLHMSQELQALCFIAGANSIHTGAKLLTTDNLGETEDHELISKLGMKILS